MKLLSVGLTETADEVKDKLQQGFLSLSQEGFRIAIDKTNKGHYTFLGCNVVEGELSFRNYERLKNILKNYVAKILAELIILREERKLVHKIIDQNYAYFSLDERRTIYENALILLNGNSESLSDFGMDVRQGRITSRINEYLDNHHELVLEGFINFRLKDYRRRLVEVVDSAVDDFMMELEYKEFIRVLRYFVDVQESKVEEVHVVISEQGRYKILDGSGKILNYKQIENFVADSSCEINFEDILLTALISISPYHIVLHTAKECSNVNLIDTIKSIFDGRVAMCAGCQMCQNLSF